MSDTPTTPEPVPAEPGAAPTSSPPTGGPFHDVEIDPAAFLPEGTVLASGDDDPEAADEVAESTVGEDVVVEELVYADQSAEAGSADPGRVDPPVGLPGGDRPGAVAAPPAPTPPEPVDLEALTRIEADLAAVDQALGALDDGSYGSCVVCARPIEPVLLAADPVRRGCADHPGAGPA